MMKKFAYRNIEAFGKLLYVVDADVAATAFKIGKVVPRNTRLLGQHVLRPSAFIAEIFDA